MLFLKKRLVCIVRFLTIDKMNHGINMHGSILENLLDLGQQSFNVFFLPFQHICIQSHAVGADTLVHVQLLVAADFFEFGVFGPGVERELVSVS